MDSELARQHTGRPTRAGPYRLLAVAGRGGMSLVYRARHSILRRQAAVKMLRERAAHVARKRDRFANEARIMCSIRHPNVAEVYDFGVDDQDRCYLAMEWLDGVPLRRLLEAGPLDVSSAIRFGSQIASVLERVHAGGILHLDIKPENVMICGAGEHRTAKLLDFGLATRLDCLTDEHRRWVDGTPHVMAPEQVTGSRLSVRTDVYGLGCLLYEMLSANRLLRRRGNRETMMAVLTQQPDPLPESLPRGLRNLVYRCLAKRDQQRPASAREVREALEMIADEVCESRRIEAAFAALSADELLDDELLEEDETDGQEEERSATPGGGAARCSGAGHRWRGTSPRPPRSARDRAPGRKK